MRDLVCSEQLLLESEHSDPRSADEEDTRDFADAQAFLSADIPAITISSQPQRVLHSFSSGYAPLNQVFLSEYYATYQLLCVLLLDIDKATRGSSPKSVIQSQGQLKAETTGPVFTDDEVTKIAAQINDERSHHGSRTLRWHTINEFAGTHL